MKSLKIIVVLSAIGLMPAFQSQAQIRINKPERVIERQAESRANRRIDQAVDKGFDKIEEGIGSIFKKKDKKEEKQENKKQEGTSEPATEAGEGANGGGRMSGGDANDRTAQSAEPGKAAFNSYSKFDFVPGEKIVASEDFSQDAVGDFPAKWNTNSSAEVVTIEGYDGKWLKFQKTDGSFIPDFVKDLPENFTLEFDFLYNNIENKYAYQQRLYTTFHETKSNDAKINEPSAGPGAYFMINGGMGKGKVELYQTQEGGGYTQLNGKRDMDEVINYENNGRIYHVSLWRQKQRLRAYVDQEKVFDFPRIFTPEAKINSMRFYCVLSEEENQYFISNIRLAVGAPDTRSKLITEGKFVTTGITFDVNSANIKPESYAVLKDIAATLTENPTVKVKIIGHTDSDGEDATNLALSKKRAESVQENLVKEFGIDKGRMQTDGKGESAPVAPNTTPEGKANNRRVEFVKM